MSNGHARLGPSNHRWPSCPGSVREEANYEDIPGSAAIDGTGSHELLELCLKNGVRADVYDGHIIATNHPDNLGGWLVDLDRCERVQMCLDYVTRRHRELSETYDKVVIESESRSNPGARYEREDWWGTVDITITCYSDEVVKCIEVVDYKDGRMWVNATDNSQLVSYVGGKLPDQNAVVDLVNQHILISNIDYLRMTIVQPKTSPVVRYEDVTAAEVLNRLNRLAAAAHRTDDPEAPLIPDSKGGKGYCRWCKHRFNCNAETMKSVDTMKNLGNDVIATSGSSLFELVSKSVDEVSVLTGDELAELADTEAGMMSVFDRVKGEIERRVQNGDSIPGYAMRPSRSSKVWNEDEESMVKVFRARKLKQDEYYPKKLISPAQALKLSNLTADQKKKLEEKYITEKAGSMKLTRVARSNKSTEEMFNNVNVVQSPSNVVQSKPEEVSFF